MITQSLTGSWQFRRLDDIEWLPALVPGSVHTDLIASRVIPDPFVGDNELRVQWVAENDWEYRKIFDPEAELLNAEQQFLVCEGLDTLAEVTLNGETLGKTENMFRQYRWDVKGLLRAGENDLVVVFRSPVRYTSARQAQRPLRGVAAGIPGAPYIRKAPCHFGWDWGPQLPPIGIWQDIHLEGRRTAMLEDVHVRQQHDDGQVTLHISTVVQAWVAGAEPYLTATLTAPNGSEQEARLKIEGNRAALQMEVKDPQLWWPNGYGEQPLYRLGIFLRQDGDVLDRRAFKLGLRTLELRQQEDEWGKSFTFVVNGVPLFAKGSNWIPADSFPTRLTDAHLERLIRSAVDTHQNMLRVWGGGLYEEDRFYDLCDRYGLLVWQDFVFACAVYPLHEPEFLENLRHEVMQNVRRLRHHPSLALWCGNNEMETGWEAWGWDQPQDEDLKAAYDRFFHHTLPEWVAELDPDTGYWPSSPSSGTPFKDTQSETQGDAHYWEVWHGRKPFTAYRRTYPRFMSEFGFQATPPLETIQTYAAPEDMNLTSYIMEFHQRGNHGNGLIIGQMTDTFQMPKDFASLVYLSMLLQAEGIRYGVEHWRRNRRRVSGTLYWQLDDCWPVTSWASLDYYGRWKALHYAARRFYAPVLLSLLDGSQNIGLHVTSDLVEPWQGRLRWALTRLDGEIIHAGQNEILVQPLSNLEVGVVAAEVSPEQERSLIFIAELLQGEQRISLQVATFVPNKHLALQDPGLSVNVRRDGDQLVFSFTAQSLARFVELSLEGIDCVFSDNYFDVPAGYSVSVTAPVPAGWSLEGVRQALRVRSLYHSYQ